MSARSLSFDAKGPFNIRFPNKIHWLVEVANLSQFRVDDCWLDNQTSRLSAVRAGAELFSHLPAPLQIMLRAMAREATAPLSR